MSKSFPNKYIFFDIGTPVSVGMIRDIGWEADKTEKVRIKAIYRIEFQDNKMLVACDVIPINVREV